MIIFQENNRYNNLNKREGFWLNFFYNFITSCFESQYSLIDKKNSVDFGTSKAWRIRFHIEEEQLYQMNTANVSISTWELEQVIFINCTR